MSNLLKRLWTDESGISATEYGIIAAVLAVGLAGILTAFKGKISTLFTSTGDKILGEAGVVE